MNEWTPLCLALVRFLVTATVLLFFGLVAGAIAWRKRGPHAASLVQRAALVALLFSGLLSALPEAPALWSAPVTVKPSIEKSAMIRVQVAPPTAPTLHPLSTASLAASPPPTTNAEASGFDVPAPALLLPGALTVWAVGASVPLIG